MNCVELQQSLAEERSAQERSEHLNQCPACATLVKELDLIVSAAMELQAADEPSPRVWNSIEFALRQEGLIRPQQPGRPSTPSFSARWGSARWLVPAAAMLLLALGISIRREALRNGIEQQAVLVVPAVNRSDSNQSDLNDADLIQEISENAPAMQSQYEENLRRVNESIRDSQTLVDESPNDSEARRSLMDAYQQKSMLFQMAMDRSAP
jgi:hypothetical protein